MPRNASQGFSRVAFAKNNNGIGGQGKKGIAGEGDFGLCGLSCLFFVGMLGPDPLLNNYPFLRCFSLGKTH